MRTVPVLRSDELETQTAHLLPQRETLCLYACTNVVNVVGVNIAIAVNAASINSNANAVAAQYLASVHSIHP